ncbi:MAG: hypothetical protein ACPGUV_10000 [Polyangiales bacterium]
MDWQDLTTGALILAAGLGLLWRWWRRRQAKKGPDVSVAALRRRARQRAKGDG